MRESLAIDWPLAVEQMEEAEEVEVAAAPAEEAEGATALAAGEEEGPSALTSYVRALRRVPRLSAEAEVQLAFAARGGCRESWGALVEGNLRLVVFCARRYRDRSLPLEDLVAEGNLGLMRAADLFDPGQGVRFATYAMWWIRARIERALINQGRTVRLSCARSAKLTRLFTLQRHLARELGREPSESEVAAAAGVDALEISALREDAKSVLSLSAPPADGCGQGLGELLPDGGISPEQRALFAQAWQSLQPAWRALSTKKRQVLVARFGLDGAPPRPLSELGQMLGVSRERVRQIEREALQALAKALAQPSGVGSASTRRRQSASAQAAASA